MGWMVMTSIPAIRHMSRKFDKTTVVCPTGFYPLCEDFAGEGIEIKQKGQADRWLVDGKVPRIPRKIKEAYPKATAVESGIKICTEAKREYVRYGRISSRNYGKILIHARAEDDYGSGERNWPLSKYRKIIKMFSEYEFASIGTKASHIKGSRDFRNIPIKALVDIMRSAELIIGPSSGPLHLAALCECPIVVWTDSKWQKSIGGTNKDRYKKIWNPFKSKVKVIINRTWNADVFEVAEVMHKVLA